MVAGARSAPGQILGVAFDLSKGRVRGAGEGKARSDERLDGVFIAGGDEERDSWSGVIRESVDMIDTICNILLRGLSGLSSA